MFEVWPEVNVIGPLKLSVRTLEEILAFVVGVIEEVPSKVRVEPFVGEIKAPPVVSEFKVTVS